MASGDVTDELKCFICLNLYRDPVYLGCGHNFCHSCIVGALDTQGGSGGYHCPKCRAKYPERPSLEKDRKLSNIMGYFLSTQPDMEKTRIFCTYCTKYPAPAVKSCLQCENSLCDDHLAAHNKTMDHMLTEPTDSFCNQKCSIHQKVLDYYCLQDAAYLCASCCLVGEHRRHQVKRLDEASEEKKKLRKYLNELNSQKTEIQTRMKNLCDHERNIQKKTFKKRKNVSQSFMDTKDQLEIAEKKARREVSRQEEKIVSQMSHGIRELFRQKCQLEEMRHVTDPIRQESDITVCSYGDDGKIKPEDDLDEDLISLTSYRSTRDIITNATSRLGFHVPDILLDVDTAHRELKLSEDLKTATRSEEEQNRPESPGRFLTFPQVLSRCGLSSGRHYWEVECKKRRRFSIGVSYPSIGKEGEQSGIALSDKAWCLFMTDTSCEALHNSHYVSLNVQPTCQTFGIFLDYDAGRLSFYELCDPIRHVHTFTASFTEPLHFITCVDIGGSVTIRS